MGKKEEVFSLYNKLNILLNKEGELLKKGDIEGVSALLEEENEIIINIEKIPKNTYIITNKDREDFAKIIASCMKKREENQKLLSQLKEKLKTTLSEMEKKKKAFKGYFESGVISPKFIDKTK